MQTHVYLYCPAEKEALWKQELLTVMPDLRLSIGPDCDHPDSVDVAVVWHPPPQGYQSFRHLRVIQSLGAGINQLAPEMIPPQVRLARLVDPALTQTMVEYVRAAVYRYHREFDLFERLGRKGQWQFRTPKIAQEVTVALLGLGVLGRAVAGSLAQDGFRVIGWSRHVKQIPGVISLHGPEGLRQVTEQADMLINLLPLTAQTRHILAMSLFERFKKPVYLINVGRGDHLKEMDLVEAINMGRIAAATLDVTAVEPLPAGSPLWRHEAILVTPHVAGITVPQSAIRIVAENIHRAMQGEDLLYQVDLSQGY